MKVKDTSKGDVFTLDCDGSKWEVVHLGAQYKRGYHVDDATYCKPLQGSAYDRLMASRKTWSHSQAMLKDIGDGRQRLNRLMNINLISEGSQTPTLTFGKHKGKPVDQVPFDYLAWCMDNCRQLMSRDAISWYKENKQKEI